MNWHGVAGGVVLLLGLAVPALVAAEQPATVAGAEGVLLRRGPGTEFQAFDTLERGQQVQVEEVTGAWALVRTEAGQHGYMHGFYLEQADGTRVASEPPPGPIAVPRAERVAAGDLTELKEQTARVLARLAQLDSEVESFRGASATADDMVELRAEVRRLADTTDALRSRLDSPAAAGDTQFGGSVRWSTSVVFGVGLSGLLVGWFVGGAVAKRQERSRRTRIRF